MLCMVVKDGSTSVYIFKCGTQPLNILLTRYALPHNEILPRTPLARNGQKPHSATSGLQSMARRRLNWRTLVTPAPLSRQCHSRLARHNKEQHEPRSSSLYWRRRRCCAWGGLYWNATAAACALLPHLLPCPLYERLRLPCDTHIAPSASPCPLHPQVPLPACALLIIQPAIFRQRQAQWARMPVDKPC